MLNEDYEAVFEDARGRERTRIHNDGHELRMSVRGIDLVGQDFDGFSPVAHQLELARSKLTLQHDKLCACRLEWTMPLALIHCGEPVRGMLAATLTLGNPHSNGGIDSEGLTLELTTPTQKVQSSGTTGYFENELLDLARKLDASTCIRACITCAFSDYNPAGQGLFGDLACFRGIKEEYLQAEGKRALFAIWERRTEYVQETYLCGEYRLRVPGTGYRG